MLKCSYSLAILIFMTEKGNVKVSKPGNPRGVGRGGSRVHMNPPFKLMIFMNLSYLGNRMLLL